MKHNGFLKTKLALIGCALLTSASTARAQSSSAQTTEVSHWKIFTSRAGWSIKYPPRGWTVVSCRQCLDPADPNVFAALTNDATKEWIMIEPLSDKPPDQSLEHWLNDVKATSVLNPRVGEEWISLDGTRALKVINRNPDSTESENIYVVRGSKTFAIRAVRNGPSYPAYRQMLSTFKFSHR